MNESKKQEVRDLLSAYVLDAVDSSERADVDTLLDQGAPDLEQELLQWSATAAALAEESAEPIEPSAMTRARLLQQVASRQASAALPAAKVPTRAAAPTALTPQPVAPSRSWLPLLTAAAALVLALIGLVRQNTRLGDIEDRLEVVSAERNALLDEVAQVRQDQDLAEQRLITLATAIQTISSPDARTIRLAGLDLAPGALGATFVRPGDDEAVFYAYNLPRLSADRVYQLWYIVGETPVSAGIFEVDDSGRGTLEVASIDRPDQIHTWAVTEEPAGGVDSPTLENMVLAGQVS